MKSAVLLLNFGEPGNPVVEEVVPFLRRIFSLNASLEGGGAEERAQRLAEARAPGLIEEYEMIGGSPLRAQAQDQATLLEAELSRRGHDVVCTVGMQFTEPFIREAVQRAHAAGAQQVIALPIYPLCGPSTTVAALQRLDDDLRQQQWSVPVHQISGWHRHPDYLAFRASAITRLMEQQGLSFEDPRTKLVFSAHGTPMKYIRDGSRYDVYVRDFCAEVARRAGAPEYVIGYQNHTNRPIDWTQPDIDTVIADIDADRVIVDPVSFMHEQSETLAELDHELRADAEARGLEFHRVPIEHDASAFITFLADITEPFLDASIADTGELRSSPTRTGAGVEWEACRCRQGARCFNASVCAPESAQDSAVRR